MTDETTLLPCPFCGGEAQLRKMDLDCIEKGWKVWGVWCVNDLHAKDYHSHGHYIDNCATEAEAIAAWNTRATPGSGKLTAEQVRETVNKHWGELNWQAIADELNSEIGGGR